MRNHTQIETTPSYFKNQINQGSQYKCKYFNEQNEEINYMVQRKTNNYNTTFGLATCHQFRINVIS